LTIAEVFILKLDKDIEKAKQRGKNYWGRFDSYFSQYTINRMKDYCEERGYFIEIQKCDYHQLYDIIISW